MAVTITDIYNDIASDRSRRLSVSSGTPLADIISAIETVLMTAPGGWTIHDAAAGTNAKCYKALQKDGTSYTYMVLDWNTTISAGVAGLCVRLYEDWNAGTHTGTNKAENTKDRSAATIAEYLQGQKLPYGETDPWQLDVHVLPGGAAFYASREVLQVSDNAAFLGSLTYGGVTVVGECLRENPNTLPAGVPAVVWFNGGHLGAVGAASYAWSACRLFDGRSSQNAATYYPGLCCCDTQNTVIGYAITGNRRVGGAGGRLYISTIIPTFAIAASQNQADYAELGAIRGVTCVGPGGAAGSVWSAACDSDYLPAIGGTNRNFRCYVGPGGPVCLLLPL
jgi:hypothetical protein